jgi:hypothetical protein
LLIVEDGDKILLPTSLADDDLENGNVKRANGFTKMKSRSEPKPEGAIGKKHSETSLKSDDAAEPGASFFEDTAKPSADDEHDYHSSLLKLVDPDGHVSPPVIAVVAVEDEGADNTRNDSRGTGLKGKRVGGGTGEAEEAEEAEDTFSLRLPQRKDRMRHASQPYPIARFKHASAQTPTRRVSVPARPAPVMRSALRRTRSREEGEDDHFPETRRTVFKPFFSLPVLTLSEIHAEPGAAEPPHSDVKSTTSSTHDVPYSSGTLHEEMQGAEFLRYLHHQPSLCNS